MMLSQPFEKPVRVWVGLGFPRQLNSVVDAYQFVTDWCGNGPEQKAAIRACKAAWPATSTQRPRAAFLCGSLGRRTSWWKTER